ARNAFNLQQYMETNGLRWARAAGHVYIVEGYNPFGGSGLPGGFPVPDNLPPGFPGFPGFPGK
ncbi:hypothetical protein BaRGS_00019586, partial [Batillaria attramentaria]